MKNKKMFHVKHKTASQPIVSRETFSRFLLNWYPYAVFYVVITLNFP